MSTTTPARKLIVCTIVSLDGFSAGPGGNPAVLPMDHAFDQYNAERLETADTLLLGRTTYDMFRGFWPGVKDMPGASEAHLTISRRDDEIDKVVVSDSITPSDTDPWSDTTTIVRRDDAVQAVRDLKARPGRDILMFGSRTLWNHLLDHGLVDEIHLMSGAVVLGAGTPAFATPRPAPMRLAGTRTWDDSSNVVHRYDLT